MFSNLKRTSFSASKSKKHGKENDANPDSFYSPYQHTNGNDLKSGDSRKKRDKKKKDRVSRTGSDTGNDSVRSRLKLLILGRPSLESLQEKGIIKENVFGCPLAKLCAKENATVPNFVKMCVTEVDKRGLDIDGIYRVSGSLSNIMKLRYLVDRDEPVNLSSPQWNEIHLITGALKMFLRELPEPVLPFNFFKRLINACQERDYSQRVQNIRILVKSLPRPNFDTLNYLMRHFNRVVSHKVSNRMEVQNIAIVFGPTLLVQPPAEARLEVPGSGEMAVNMHYQNFLIETILIECEYIFK